MTWSSYISVASAICKTHTNVVCPALSWWLVLPLLNPKIMIVILGIVTQGNHCFIRNGGSEPSPKGNVGAINLSALERCRVVFGIGHRILMTWLSCVVLLWFPVWTVLLLLLLLILMMMMYHHFCGIQQLLQPEWLVLPSFDHILAVVVSTRTARAGRATRPPRRRRGGGGGGRRMGSSSLSPWKSNLRQPP
jgi:hypothetical protein